MPQEAPDMTGDSPDIKYIGANGRDAVRDPDTGEQVYVSQLVAAAIEGVDPGAIFGDESTVVHHRNRDPWCDWDTNLAVIGRDTHGRIHSILS